MNVQDTKFEPKLLDWINRVQRIALVIGVVGLAASILGAIIEPSQFFRSWLFGFLPWIGLSVGSLLIYMLHHLVGGAWGFLIRRLCSAAARVLPLMLLLFIPILFGLHDLYPWTRAATMHEPAIATKAGYLNEPFFLVRQAIYFLIWIFWAFNLFRLVRKLELTNHLPLIRKMQNFSAGGIVLVSFAITFAAFDWVMSLEPTWASTIFGFIFMVGDALLCFTFVTMLLLKLAPFSPMKNVVRPQIFQDLGNLIFAFTMLWAYLGFMQYLIIWAGNLSEEVIWYVHRTQGGWEWIAFGLIFLHFFVPFFILLNRRAKRNREILFWTAGAVFVLQVIDLYWYVMPTFEQGRLRVHWLDFATVLGIGGAWIFYYMMQLKRRPLLILSDPRLEEAIARIDEREPQYSTGPDFSPYGEEGAKA